MVNKVCLVLFYFGLFRAGWKHTNCATAGYLQQNNGPACNNWNIWDGIFGTEWTERMESWVGFLGAAWCCDHQGMPRGDFHGC